MKLDDDVALKNTIDGDCPAFPALSVDADTLDYAPFCTDTWRQNGEHLARVAKLHAEASATGSIREKEPGKGETSDALSCFQHSEITLARKNTNKFGFSLAYS